MQDGLLKKVERRRLYEDVVEQIKALIVERKLKKGDRLPSEREIAAYVGVGRQVVRDAIRTLATMGLVEVRPGEGTFVSGLNLDLYVDTLAEYIDLKLLAEEQMVHKLLEVRQILEEQVVLLAVERAVEADLERARRTVEKQRECLVSGDIEGFNQADADFHLALARATQNEVLYYIVQSLSKLLMESRRRTNSLPGIAAMAFADHKSMMDALERRDAQTCKDRMRRHLEATRENLARAFMEARKERK